MSSEHAQSVIETSSAIASASAKTTMVAGGSAAAAKVMGLDPITLIGLVVGVGGLIVSILGFIVNWHYKSKDEKRKLFEEQRKQEIHLIQIQQLVEKQDAK